MVFSAPQIELQDREDAFAALVEQYEQSVFSLAMNLTGCETDAEQVQLKVFAALWKNEQHSVQAGCSYLDVVERTLAEAAALLEGRAYSIFRVAADGKEEQAGLGRLAEAICSNLQKLPFEYRRVFVLRDILGLTPVDICKVLGITSEQCQASLTRARLMLRRGLLRDRVNIQATNKIHASEQAGREAELFI